MNVRTAATSDEVVSPVIREGHNPVTASGDASLHLITGKRMQPTDTALIPNQKALDPCMVKSDWFNVGNKIYDVPY